MNERLLFLLAPWLIVPGRAATLAQVPAPPVTQTSPGVPAGPPPRDPPPALATTSRSLTPARATSPDG